MEKISVKGNLVFAFLLVFVFSLNGFSQSKKEAVDAFNQGVSLLKTNPKGAVEALTKCIEISDQLGEEGDETKTNAEQQLPLAYYGIALNSYKQKQVDKAIQEFSQAKEIAKKYNNSEIEKKAERIIPQLYYVKGNALLQKKDYEGALTSYNQSLDLQPAFAKPWLRIGQIHKITGDIDKMLGALDKAIEVGMTTHDRKTVAASEKLAKNTLYNNAVGAIEKKDWEKAEGFLKKSIEYGNGNPGVYYQLGKVYNNLGKWDMAISNLQKAVEMDKGEPAAKAKYFYELGNAYKSQGNNTKACDAFKKALYGPYQENAKYQIETVLKCK